jgi:hypothetical protein
MRIVPQFLERFRQVVGVAARQRADERRERQQADAQRCQRSDEGQDVARFQHAFIIPGFGARYKVGGGGAPLYAMQEQEPTQAAFAGAYHFVLVRIGGDRLWATAISSGGEVLDEFERSAE